MIPDLDSLSVHFKPLRSGQIIQLTVCLSKVLWIYLFKWSSYIQKIMCELCLHQGLLLKKQQRGVTPAKSGSPSVKLIVQRWVQFSHSMKICHYTQLFNLVIPKQIILVPKKEFSNVLSTHVSIIGQLRITVWPLGRKINKERRIFLLHISFTVNTQTGNGS